MEGTLFIVGGGLKKSQDEVFSEIIKRAGGTGSKFAFITTASGLQPDELFADYREEFKKLGVPEENCVLIPVYAEHITDKMGRNALSGDAEGLCDFLNGVSGVWFSGGDQRRIVNAYLRKDGSDTEFLKRLREIYYCGGVIGGTSAGAAMMSEVMIGGGNNKGVLKKAVIFGYPEHKEMPEEDCEPLVLAQGLGFFPYGVIDQHFNKRPRLLRLIESCMSNKKNTRLAFGVSEDTALIYSSGKIQVLGSAGVYIVDCRKAEKASPGCYKGVELSAMQKGDSYELSPDELKLSKEESEGESLEGRDYFSGNIEAENFDGMIHDYLLFGYENSICYDSEKKMPYIKTAEVYSAGGKLYLPLVRYYKTAATRGYMGAHCSFKKLEVEINTVTAEEK